MTVPPSSEVNGLLLDVEVAEAERSEWSPLEGVSNL